MARTLKRAFYTQNTEDVARQLLGKILCVRRGKQTLRSRIVETEAYLGIDDPACHSFGGRRTLRTENMYREGGHAYVYLIYGIYNCFNVVSYLKDHPEAVLVRAVEVLNENLPAVAYRTNGPGRLCRALGITRADNGVDLTRKDRLWIEEPAEEFRFRIRKVPRVGVDYAGAAAQWRLRFYIRGHASVSRL